MSEDKVRLDKWLWAARFFKTRSLAADAVDGGKVHVNDSRVKRAKEVSAGDIVRVRLANHEQVVVVRGLSDRRGPASIAQALYEETADSISARERAREQARYLPHAFAPERGRPTKKDRREIKRFLDDR